jgi:hypothetical protein|tara:strand:- start:5201 stop:5620 length:420 start_codon:yes stop_codon:yes gene_type:complete
MSRELSSARVFYCLARYFKNKMIKSTIAALAATPLLFSGAAFAGPYVNIEATGSYPDGAYTSGGLEAVIGYEGTTEGGLGYYVSGGPTVTHTESTDEFGDVELVGYLGGSYDKFYGEISGTTNNDDIDWGAKAGVKFVF